MYQAATVRHEMLLLSNMLQLDDSLWEQRVRCGQYNAAFTRLYYTFVVSK